MANFFNASILYWSNFFLNHWRVRMFEAKLGKGVEKWQGKMVSTSLSSLSAGLLWRLEACMMSDDLKFIWWWWWWWVKIYFSCNARENKSKSHLKLFVSTYKPYHLHWEKTNPNQVMPSRTNLRRPGAFLKNRYFNQRFSHCLVLFA